MAELDTDDAMTATMRETYDRIDGEEKAARAEEAKEAASVSETPEPATEASPSPESRPAPVAGSGEPSQDRNADGTFKKAPKQTAKTAAPKSAAAPAGTQAAQTGQDASSTQKTGNQPAQAAAQTGSAPAGQANSDQPSTGLAGVNPPAGWSAAAKAMWAQLPPAVQAAVSRRESEVSQGFQQYEGLGRVLAPMQQALQMRGVTPAAYVQQLIQAESLLANPATRAQAFDYLFRTYGYQPQAQHQTHATDPAQAGQVDPTQAALYQQVQNLTNGFNSIIAQRQAEERQIIGEIQQRASTDVAAFRNDAKNEFFDIVQDDIRRIYETAAATQQPMQPLAQVYEQAVWANPQTRPVLLAREAQKRETATQQAASQAAANARRTAGPNVRGNIGAVPSNGAVPLTEDAMRKEMAEVFDRLNA